ncbi:hypothetical protein CUMW_098380 [Citrus unshiu]|uniref:EF-hand domain-containing protein n=1 Tax=Citrus unshiu TaxID=55188 RepID=A0A2H5P2V9_CITUN|nr:hypothetical protein CUMW_098380 [Citrus unshiu]
MEDLNEVALAYYESGTDEERRLFDQFFESMDEDGNGRVSYREFSEFMSLEAYDRNMCTRDFFNDLDVDGSRGLDFNEVLTLYYIIKSGRPICRQCKIFITNEYFTCTRCFKTRSFPYNICLECFRGEGGHFNHTHSLEQFVDNFALLECLRKEALEEIREDGYYEPSPSRSRSQRIVPYSRYPSENSSHHAIVPYNPNIPAERRNRWGTAFRILETGLHFASVVTSCSIM